MIKLGKIDKKIFLPISAGLLFWPFSIMRSYTEMNNHYTILSLCSSMGMMLSIIPLLISRKNMKRAMSNKNFKYKEKKSKNIEISLIYNKSSVEIKRYKFLYIFLSSLCDFLQTLLATIIYNNTIKVNFWLLDLVFLSSLSYFLLNTKLFRHQILSMLIIIILGIILDFLFGSLDKILDNIAYFLLRIFSEFCYSLSVIINKYCMEFKFSPPYEICLFIGIFTFLLYLILLIISSYLPCKFEFCIVKDENKNLFYFDNFLIYISKMNIKEFFLFLIEMIMLGIINLFTLLTLKHYSPCHTLIILIIGRIIILIEKFFINIELYDIMSIIIMIFILLILLVYVEIIILNFCEIQKNTKENIELRSELDTVLTERDSNHGESLLNLNIENDIEDSIESSSRNSSNW